MKPAFSGEGLPLFSHADTWVLVIPAAAKNKEAALAFMDYFGTEEALRQAWQVAPGIPPLRSMLRNPVYGTGPGAYQATVIEAARKNRLRVWGPWPEQGTLIYNIWWPIMQSVFNGSMGIDAALAKMTTDANLNQQRARVKYKNVPKTTIAYGSLPPGLTLS